MADYRCLNHGGTMIDFFGECPECRILKEQRRIQEDAADRAEELARRQADEREDADRRMEEAMEEDREERERILEEAHWRQEKAQQETEQRQRENLANAYKYESKSKSDQAAELLKAGLFKESIKLAEDSISQDPSNIYGHLVLSKCLMELKKHDESKEALHKALLLLKTPRWHGDAYVHSIAFRFSFPFEDLRSEFLSILDKNCERLIDDEKCKVLITDLIKNHQLKEAAQLFTSIANKNNISGKEWWQVYFDLLSAMTTEKFAQEDIGNLVRLPFKKNRSDNEIMEILITMVFATKVDPSLLSKTVANLSYKNSSLVWDTMQKIRNNNYGGYSVQAGFSGEAISLVDRAIKEVEEKVWKPTYLLVGKESELSEAKGKVEELTREKDSMTGGGMGCLAGFITWVASFGLIAYVGVQIFQMDGRGGGMLGALATFGSLAIGIVAGQFPRLYAKSKKTEEIRKVEANIYSLEAEIKRMRDQLTSTSLDTTTVQVPKKSKTFNWIAFFYMFAVFVGFILVYIFVSDWAYDKPITSSIITTTKSRFNFSELTVLDTATKLMWPQDANLPGGSMTLATANDYIKKLNKQRYAGYNNWRLPSKDELKTLVDYASNQGIKKNISELYNKIGFQNVQSDYYWSSTPHGINVVGVWLINMGNGSMQSYGASSDVYVWPVRSSDSRFNSSALTVSDSVTKLMWIRDANLPRGVITWYHANDDYIKWINENRYGGYGDWRLPSKDELKALVDSVMNIGTKEENSGPYNKIGFQNVQSGCYWSSTSENYSATRAWIVCTGDSHLSSNFKSNPFYYVWPVRSGQ